MHARKFEVRRPMKSGLCGGEFSFSLTRAVMLEPPTRLSRRQTSAIVVFEASSSVDALLAKPETQVLSLGASNKAGQGIYGEHDRLMAEQHDARDAVTLAIVPCDSHDDILLCSASEGVQAGEAWFGRAYG